MRYKKFKRCFGEVDFHQTYPMSPEEKTKLSKTSPMTNTKIPTRIAVRDFWMNVERKNANMSIPSPRRKNVRKMTKK
jgi:hypothetical protein